MQRYHGKKKWPATIDHEKRTALIVEYAPLVKLLANRLAMRVPPSVSLDDLISAGIMGLLDAVDRFDPARQVQFKTYAEFRIRGAMLDELRSLDWVPRSTRKKIHDMEKAIMAVESRRNGPADDEEIAEEMGVDLETFYSILNMARGIELLSLDGYIKDNTNSSESKKSFKSLIRGDDDPNRHIMMSEMKEIIAEAIRSLSKKEQMVISLYYYDELTLKEIGEVLGLTESRISQIHTKAIIKMRVKLKHYCGT
ncbi:MAG: FliA/WhiG family RNA polymerase sigma factor [Deltaproteobacteria bacterium]|nr:FliA/WhiG family RNA polymerase sigma factor [Deltaproteobacteria bacterium]